MPSPAAKKRSLPLVLSLVSHALALAALAYFAPLGRAPVRDGEPVTIRLARPRLPAAELVDPPPAIDRHKLPEEPAAPVIQPALASEDELLSELPEEAPDFASEIPASAQRSAIGVRAAGSLRVPRAQAGAMVHEVALEGAAKAAPLALLVGSPAPEAPTPPVPLVCVAPEYPAACASVSEQGRVRLEIHIDAAGRVDSVRVLRTSGFARLDEAAVVGVRRWRFQPAREAGVAVPWRLEHTIAFRVTNAAG